MRTTDSPEVMSWQGSEKREQLLRKPARGEQEAELAQVQVDVMIGHDLSYQVVRTQSTTNAVPRRAQHQITDACVDGIGRRSWSRGRVIAVLVGVSTVIWCRYRKLDRLGHA